MASRRAQPGSGPLAASQVRIKDLLVLRRSSLSMPARRSKRRSRRRLPRGRFLLRWLAVAVVGFVAFLYSQPLRNYLSTRDALAERTREVRELRARKLRPEQRLVDGDTPEAVTREARRLGYIKPGERLFIVKGIAAWRRQHEQSPR